VSRRIRQLHNLKRYGLSQDDFDAMLEIQEYACAICLETEDRLRADGTEMPLSVDHCHRTERDTGVIKVRGLLCARCNTALGLFRDDPEALRRAIDYLGY